jgi:tRNA threonylcarbamoyladenosine modification (KEOPS) complex  Pcc1 subunit
LRKHWQWKKRKLNSAIVRLKFPSKRGLEIVFEALKPEVDKPATVRSRAKLGKEDKFLVLKIEARDSVALRAALNAYLRWINSALNVLEVLERQ